MSARPRVGIVDYGSGNLLSVRHALERCGVEVDLLTDPAEVLAAERVILPGVGAFPAAMRRLNAAGLDEALKTYAQSGRPLLGICLGMQLLAESSEEFGMTSGLGLIPGKVERMPTSDLHGRTTRVPFVGWARSSPTPLTASVVPVAGYFYFVHSYRFVAAGPGNILASYQFEGHDVVAAIGADATVGVQFHPERSGLAGLEFLRAFANPSEKHSHESHRLGEPKPA